MAKLDQRAKDAYHEAGHGGWELLRGGDVLELSIDEPDAGVRGKTRFEPPKTDWLKIIGPNPECAQDNADLVLDQIKNLLAGPTTEVIARSRFGDESREELLTTTFLPQNTIASSPARAEGHDIPSARLLVGFLIKKTEVLPGSDPIECLKRLYREVEESVLGAWDSFCAVAEVLLSSDGRVSGSQVRTAWNSGKRNLPDEEVTLSSGDADRLDDPDFIGGVADHSSPDFAEAKTDGEVELAAEAIRVGLTKDSD